MREAALVAVLACVGTLALGGETGPAKAITVRGVYFDELVHGCRREGVTVVQLGPHKPLLTVPYRIRHRPLEIGRILSEVAAHSGVAVSWQGRGDCAVLQMGATDADLDRVRQGLAREVVADRRHAAWLAGWLGDARAIPLLVATAVDPKQDMETQSIAMAGLRRAGWDAVIAIDPAAKALLQRELACGDTYRRLTALEALGAIDFAAAEPTLRKEVAAGVDLYRVGKVIAGVSAHEAVPFLQHLLKHDSERLRWAAARALANVGDDEALSALRSALSHASEATRHDAAAAIGSIRTPGALAALLSAIRSEDINVRGGAARGLGTIGSEEAIAALQVCMRDKRWEVRQVVCWGLGHADGGSHLTLAQQGLRDERPEVRSAAIEAFGRIGSPEAVATLREIRADDNRTRASLCRAFKWLKIVVGPETVRQAIASDDYFVRFDAVMALGGLDSDSFVPVATMLLEQKDPYGMADWTARELAIRMRLGAAGQVERWLESPSALVRCRAAEVAGHLGGEPALRILERCLADETTDMKCAALKALGHLGGPRALELLVKHVGGVGKTEVRTAAVFALGTTGCASRYDFVSRLLDAPEPAMRAAAVVAAPALGGELAWPRVVQALSDKSRDVRCAAATTIIRGWPEKHAEAAITMLEDEDELVRASVAGSLSRVYDSRVAKAFLRRLDKEQDETIKKGIVRALETYKHLPEVAKALEQLKQPKGE